MYKYLFETLLSLLWVMKGVLQSHRVILWTAIWGTSILSYTAAIPFYIPTRNIQGFQFLIFFTNTCYFLWLIKKKTYKQKVTEHCQSTILQLKHILKNQRGIFILFWMVLSLCVCVRVWQRQREKEIHPSFPDGVSHVFFLSHLLSFLGKFNNLLLHSCLELPA